VAQQKKDLFSQIGDDVLKAVVNRVVPKPRGKGRPKKVLWEDRLANTIISSKIGLPALGVWVLWNKGAITGEQAAMVIHYVAANQDLLSIPELYPTNANWVVKKALQEFGLDVTQLNVTWGEMMDLVGQLVQIYQLTQQQTGQAQSPVVGPAGQTEDANELLKKFQGMPAFDKVFAGFKGFSAPVAKPAEASGKNVDKTEKSG